MGMIDCTSFINGAFLDAASLATASSFQPLNPTTGESVPERYLWDDDGPQQAVLAARESQRAWGTLPLAERVDAIRRFLTPLTTHARELSGLITRDMGKLPGQADEEVAAPASRLSLMIEEAERLLTPVRNEEAKAYEVHAPYGVTGIVGPWNYPLRIPLMMAIAALLTGNTVALKPASNTPGPLRRFVELTLEEGVALPAGVFNLVFGRGSVGDALARHPEVGLLLFTGSADVGEKIKASAAKTPKALVMEMVGQGPVVVLPDANLDEAVKHIVEGAFGRNIGQNCNATRIVFLVGGEREAEFLAKVQAGLATRIIGDPFAPGVQIGPLATSPADGFSHDLNAVLAMTGATQVYHPLPLPPGLPPNGFFVKPTVYRIPEASFDTIFNPVNRIEVFGPALGYAVVDSVEEAVYYMNRMAGALTAGIHAADRARAMDIARRLNFGQVRINKVTSGASPLARFGGPGWATFGGYGGKDLVRNTVFAKTID